MRFNLCYNQDYAGVAELADARDSKSRPKGCGFESLHRHHYIILLS